MLTTIRVLSLVGAALVAGAAITGVAAHEYAATDIEVRHPWARATPGGTSVGAAFLEIASKSKSDDKLIGANSPIAGKVEIHAHEHADGVMRMRKVDGLDVPAGASVVLKPAGYHVMLFDLKKPLVEGELLPLTLVFEKSGAVTIDATIEPVGARGPHGLDHQPTDQPKAGKDAHEGHGAGHDGHGSGHEGH
ncbi:MAG: copper chaperone PCu(A)C [Hyphomicrobium sp.]|nr:copper chaperone PCu(A)C [Hyphomicrobium sp.]